MIGRSSGNAKRVVTVDGTSREHARLRAAGCEPTTKDLDRCSGATLDREKLMNGHLRLIKVGAHISQRDVELDTHRPTERY